MDLVNQSGTISSMVETPAMLLHTINTIALAPLVLGKTSFSNDPLLNALQHSIMEYIVQQPDFRSA